MKIRTGFVSNSSSSNFIISGKRHTVFSVAKEMLAIRTDHNWPECPELDRINEAEQLNVDPDTPIAFKTCNFNTYIFKFPDKHGEIYVETCSDHAFSDMDCLEDPADTAIDETEVQQLKNETFSGGQKLI